MHPLDESLPPSVRRELAALDRAEWASFHLRWALGYALGLVAGAILGPIGLFVWADDDGGPAAGIVIMLLGSVIVGPFLAMGFVALLHATATLGRAFRRRGWARSRRLPGVE
jgi:hypothetical protein